MTAAPGDMRRVAGFPAFLVVWTGQSVSVFGNHMTNFALVVWLWSSTGHAMPIVLLELCSYSTVVVLGPVAGVVCDRWGVTRTLIASNIGAALAVVLLWALYAGGSLSQQWAYLAMVMLGASLAFQYPALTAAVTSLVPERHYMRASGMLSLSVSTVGIVAPAAAAFLLPISGLGAVFAADVVSYGVAVLTLGVVRIPRPEPADTRVGRRRIFGDLLVGFRFIFAQPGLPLLQLLFFLSYFAGMFGVLLAPMVLARSTDGTAILAAVLAAAGLGGVVGGLVTVGWVGRRRMPVILIGFALTGLLGQLPLGLSGSAWVWATASFISALLFPIIQGANQALWQTRVPLAVQGRVFAARRVMTESAPPIALLLAGPLADHVFEPAMRTGDTAPRVFAWLVGTGPGAGMAVIFLFSGLLSMLIGTLGFAASRLREFDKEVQKVQGGAVAAEESAGRPMTSSDDEFLLSLRAREPE